MFIEKCCVFVSLRHTRSNSHRVCGRREESINEDDDIETTISFHRLHNCDDVIIDAIDVTQTTESIDSSKCDQVSHRFSISIETCMHTL